MRMQLQYSTDRSFFCRLREGGAADKEVVETILSLPLCSCVVSFRCLAFCCMAFFRSSVKLWLISSAGFDQSRMMMLIMMLGKKRLEFETSKGRSGSV